MRHLLLVMGAGGHGKVVAEAACATEQWEEIAFLDDRLPVGSTVAGCPIYGVLEDRAKWRDAELVVAIGDNATRVILSDRLLEQGRAVATVVHPSAVVSPSVRLGAGCVVFAGAIVQADTLVSRACIINTGASVDHDCTLGAGVHVSPGARLGGQCHVGDRTWIGIGAAVGHGILIGSDVTVGAGAAVISDMPDGVVAVGVPARPAVAGKA